MSLISVRKRSLTVETIYHELGPAPALPLRMAAACAVAANPYAGRYEPDLMPFMTELRSLGHELATELVETLGGRSSVEVYSKAAIVGLNGEMEHGAVWHEAGGWAMRETLGQPKAMVPANKAVAGAGYRIMVPVHTSTHPMYAAISTVWRSAFRMPPGQTRYCSRSLWARVGG